LSAIAFAAILFGSGSYALAQDSSFYAGDGYSPTAKTHFYTLLLGPLGGFALLVLGGGGLAFLLVGGESRTKENYLFGGVLLSAAAVIFVIRVFVSTGLVEVLDQRAKDRAATDSAPIASSHEVNPLR
jgi:hypothetical protein